MSAIAMPKFAIKKLDVTDEQFAAPEEKKGGKFLQPGSHDVKIKEVTTYGANAKDPTWFSVRIKYVGANGGEISDFLMLPTAKLTYAGAKSPAGATFPLRRIQGFYAALGIDFKPSLAQEVLQATFGTNKLAGKELSIQVGYKGTHAKYDATTKGFVLADKDGLPHRQDKTGDVLTFSSRDEVKAYCIANGVEIQAFPDVTAYTPTDIMEATDAEDEVAF